MYVNYQVSMASYEYHKLPRLLWRVCVCVYIYTITEIKRTIFSNSDTCTHLNIHDPWTCLFRLLVSDINFIRIDHTHTMEGILLAQSLSGKAATGCFQPFYHFIIRCHVLVISKIANVHIRFMCDLSSECRDVHGTYPSQSQCYTQSLLLMLSTAYSVCR